MIDLYWQVGEYISRKIEAAEWGDGIVPQLAQYIASRSQGGEALRAITVQNEAVLRELLGYTIVGPLARQLPWTHNLIILGQSKRPDEREFYLRRQFCNGLLQN